LAYSGTFALGALGRVAGRYDPAIGADAGGGFSAAWITHIPAKGGVCNDPNLSFCQRVVVHARRYAFEAPIPGDRVSVRDDADPTHRRIDVMSKTSVISTAPGISLDPITNGAWLQVYNATGTGESVCLSLPAGGWSATGAPSTPGLRYRDTAAAYGPCSRAELRHGKQLKVSCLARAHPIAYSLDEVSQGAVAVRLASGTASYCMVFGGLVRHDSHVEFKALRAPTPVSCAPPPVPCP